MGKTPLVIALAACICVFNACTTPPTPPKSDKWQVNDMEAFDKYPASVSLSLEAEPDSTKSVMQENKPSLNIECGDDGRTTFWVSAGEKDIEAGYHQPEHTMWIQLDDKPVFFEDDWYQFREGGEVDAPRPIRFVQQVSAAKLLTLKYTSYSQVVLRFDVRGLGTYLPKVAEDCGWKIGTPTGTPPLSKIRKAFLDGYFTGEDKERIFEEWRQKVQSHTCVQAVAKLKDADAILHLDSEDTTLTSKDGETIWSQKMGYTEYKPLNRAVGCAKTDIHSAVPSSN